MHEVQREAMLPYWDSDVALAVAETLALNFVDVDGTMTSSDGEPSSKEVAEREEAVELLKEGGRPIALNTARTIELAVSSAMRVASQLYGLDRPEPKLGMDQNGRPVSGPEQIPKFRACIDPHIFCGFGTGIYPRHKESFYVPDRELTEKLGHDWHADALAFLLRIDALDREWRLTKALADIEDERNYYSGKSDVWPLEYRIQLEWTEEEYGERAEALKNSAKRRIRFWHKLFRPSGDWDHLARRIDILDESNPARGRFVIYLVPHIATKEKMLNRVIRKVAEAVNLVPSQLSTFVAGDTMTDLRAGFAGGNGTNVTFLLAGGSRLYHYLSPNGLHAGERYQDEDFVPLTKRLKRGQTEDRGVYKIKMPFDTVPRTIILGDEAFQGELGPASIAATLEFLRKKVKSITRQH